MSITLNRMNAVIDAGRALDGAISHISQSLIEHAHKLELVELGAADAPTLAQLANSIRALVSFVEFSTVKPNSVIDSEYRRWRLTHKKSERDRIRKAKLRAYARGEPYIAGLPDWNLSGRAKTTHEVLSNPVNHRPIVGDDLGVMGELAIGEPDDDTQREIKEFIARQEIDIAAAKESKNDNEPEKDDNEPGK